MWFETTNNKAEESFWKTLGDRFKKRVLPVASSTHDRGNRTIHEGTRQAETAGNRPPCLMNQMRKEHVPAPRQDSVIAKVHKNQDAPSWEQQRQARGTRDIAWLYLQVSGFVHLPQNHKTRCREHLRKTVTVLA
jgi:hypothetical protein